MIRRARVIISFDKDTTIADADKLMRLIADAIAASELSYLVKDVEFETDGTYFINFKEVIK